MLARVKRSMEAIGQRTHVPVVTGVKMRLPWGEGAEEVEKVEKVEEVHKVGHSGIFMGTHPNPRGRSKPRS